MGNGSWLMIDGGERPGEARTGIHRMHMTGYPEHPVHLVPFSVPRRWTAKTGV
jgi:hypothetical protein